MAFTPTAPDVASEHRPTNFRSVRCMCTPPPFLGATVVSAPQRCSAVVIAVGTDELMDTWQSDRGDAAATAVIFVDRRNEAAGVERRRQVVATYRWLLSQQIDPTAVTLVVPGDEKIPLRAFFTHCGDPEPGGIISAGRATAEEPTT